MDGSLQAVALMVLKQSDDPKFHLYGDLPSPAASPAMNRSGSGGYPGGSVQQFAPQQHPHYGGGHYGGGGGGMPYGMMGGGGGGEGGSGFTSLSLMLTEDQACVLLEHGSRAVMEVEQVRCAVHAGLCGCAGYPPGRALLPLPVQCWPASRTHSPAPFAHPPPCHR